MALQPRLEQCLEPRAAMDIEFLDEHIVGETCSLIIIVQTILVLQNILIYDTSISFY